MRSIHGICILVVGDWRGADPLELRDFVITVERQEFPSVVVKRN